MEFLLLPNHRGDPPIPVPRTPYAAKEYYDGGPWLSYPARKGRPTSSWNGIEFDLTEHHRLERLNPTPVKDREDYIQTWLYFGLIAEFIGVNLSDEACVTPTPHLDAREAISQIYNLTLVEDGDQTYVRLSVEVLDTLLEMGRARLSPDPEVNKQHYNHFILCLSYAQPLLFALPKEFSYSIKFSIAALGELFAASVTMALTSLKAPANFGWFWTGGFLTEEVKSDMRRHGWCPSDIARAEDKYTSLQVLYLVRMMDKSLPSRDHSHCTEFGCNQYQIIPEYHQSRHQNQGCSCAELGVNSEDLNRVLLGSESFPLLRFIGEANDLEVELVECKPDTPYVAISHVWADGLGNPTANSLHRCKLHHLRELVRAMAQTNAQSASQPQDAPLIWLDTLCSPAHDGPGKQVAIERIRLVYSQAAHVLVLDAGLMSYSAFSQDISEFLARVFTSSWMRRLWTLQEGALANSLYLQSSDAALPFAGLANALIENGKLVRHRTILFEFWKEFLELQYFFYPSPDAPLGASVPLRFLDQALQFRSVSVSTDEPLCIATLLSLDLSTILQVQPTQNRMQKVWELIAVQRGGLPAPIIFFDEPRIETKGWRWAPRSLLLHQKGAYAASTRALRWDDEKKGTIAPNGFEVRYPGFRVKLKQYADSRPRNPWPGMVRTAEFQIMFRETHTMQWYTITEKMQASRRTDLASGEERRKNDVLGLFSLSHIAKSDNAAIISNMGREGIFAIITSEEDETIIVETKLHIITGSIHPELGYMYDVIERVAMTLRDSEMTDAHLALYDSLVEACRLSGLDIETAMKENEEFQLSVRGLHNKMREMLTEVVSQDERFVNAVKEYYMAPKLDTLWGLVLNWFWQGFEGKKIEDSQVWIVD